MNLSFYSRGGAQRCGENPTNIWSKKYVLKIPPPHKENNAVTKKHCRLRPKERLSWFSKHNILAWVHTSSLSYLLAMSEWPRIVKSKILTYHIPLDYLVFLKRRHLCAENTHDWCTHLPWTSIWATNAGIHTASPTFSELCPLQRPIVLSSQVAEE